MKMNSDAKPQLDSGWSWLVLTATFCVNFIKVDVVFAILYYDIVQTFNVSVGSVGLMLTISKLAFSIPSLGLSSLLKKFGYRKLGLVGAFWSSLCLACSAFSPNITVFTVLLGLTGPGFAAEVHVCSVALQDYFEKRRGFAGGIAATGISAGYFALGPIIQYISEIYGWRGALLIFSGLHLNNVVAVSLLRPQSSQKEINNVRRDNHKQTDQVKKMPEESSMLSEDALNISPSVDDSVTPKTSCPCLCDLSLLKDPSTTLFLIGIGSSVIGIATLYSHLPNRCLYIGMSEREAAWMSSLFGICNAAGRLIFTAVVTLTPMSITIQSCVLLFISSLATMAVGLTHGILDSAVALVVAAVSLGGHVCVVMTSLRDIAGIDNYPTAMALDMLIGGTVRAFGVFFAGYIYDITSDYNKSFLICGGIEAIGAVIACISVIFYQRKMRNERNQTKRDMCKTDSDSKCAEKN